MVKRKKKTSKEETRIEKQLLKVGGFILLLVVIYFVASAFFKARNQFEYEGLSFSIERHGGLPIYHYYYYFTTRANSTVQYNLYLLHDPRTNPVPVTGDPVIYGARNVYITLDTSLPICMDNAAALLDLSQFISGNEFTIRQGFMNESYAEEKDEPYVTCKRLPNSEVIEFFAGNATEVRIDRNCHQIIIGPDCKIREAVEKFKVRSILDAKRLASSSAL